MPFGEGSSSSAYGAHGSSSSHHEAEQPLRSRQNTRGYTNSPAPSDLLFSNPQSSFDDFPYPPYSELPFTTLKRRKHSSQNQVVKWAMRAVLLSPVVVLVLWSIGAMIFSKNVNQKTNNKYNNRMNSKVRNNQRMMYGMMAPQPNNMYMMPPQMYGMASQPFRQMGSNMVAPLYSVPQGNEMNQNLAMNPLMVTQQQQMMPQQSSNMIVQPQGLQPLQQQLGLQPPQQQLGLQLPQQQQPMMLLQGKLMEPNAMMVQAPLQQQEQPQVLMQPAYMEAPPQLQMQRAMQEPAPLLQEPPTVVAATPGIVSQDALGSSARTAIHHPSHMRGSTDGATVFYYDPQQTSPGENGQVLLPSTVYDAQGNPVDLASLAAQNQVQILLESPLQQAQPQQQVAMRQEEPLYGEPLLIEQDTPLTQMSAPDIKRWGESTAQDQSIIVGTVAVMAMLVGALSARRLRNRSVLSACIENESLEDDVAYDAAYSTTMPHHNDVGSSYNTFGGGGWKGDLEKFDV